MLNWQGKKTAETENTENDAVFRVGIVESATANGVTVKFAGEETAGAKRYKYNKTMSIAPGDRVLLGRVAGSYVIICEF